MNNKIQAVIFDMDGVLIDARDWHYEALNRALRLFGIEISRYEHLVTFDGLPTKKKLEMLTLEGRLPARLHTLINKLKQEYTMEMVYSKCKPIFQHQYALSQLKHDGYHLVVCSNSIKRTIDIMMDRAKLIEYLDFFLSNEDVQHSKPDPEIYTRAMERLKIKPENCLIVEDNDNGIKAALASGAHLMRVSNPNGVNYHNIVHRINEISHA
ncbi:MAG: HAD family hydrolase [Flavisolibacter sp.]|jgi:beta-phosphoglucomutase